VDGLVPCPHREGVGRDDVASTACYVRYVAAKGARPAPQRRRSSQCVPPPDIRLTSALHYRVCLQHVGQQTFIPLDAHPAVGQFNCEGHTLENISACLADDGAHVRPGAAVQTPLEGLTIECVSVEPKAFKIVGMLTDFETDYIINQASPRLHQSTVGNAADARDSNTRTSKSAWLRRGHSEITEAIYARVQMVTRVPEDAMREGNVESLNILKYATGAEYTPHYDWSGDGKVSSRFVTTLLFLNTPEGGGATSFPKARMPDNQIGTEVRHWLASPRGPLILFSVFLSRERPARSIPCTCNA
jgi:hypothetical protein